MQRGKTGDTRSSVTLYVTEEQQILREAYEACFLPYRDLTIVGTSGDTSGEAMVTAALSLTPDVMLLGVKVLQPVVLERLKMVRESCPGIGMVLLSSHYDVQGIKALREFSWGTSAGCAYLLKHTIDTADQLGQVIHSVAEGRIIVDPMVMQSLLAPSESKSTVLKELSPREMEVLGWMARSYRNNAIAEVLFLEPKTVERHINNIYSKLGSTLESKHPRVQAITMFLRETGVLSAGGYLED